jgi:hypothetical protein
MTDTTLFDDVFEQALGGDGLDRLMERQAAAAARGDWEQVRLIDEIVRVAAILGTHAVTAETTQRNKN